MAEPSQGAAVTAVEDIVREILKKHSRTQVSEIRFDDKITKDCGLDSMALLESVLDVEERLQITIPENRMPELVDLTFSEFVAFLRAEVETQRSIP